jgi:putative ABC transport system permease protein
VTRTDKVTFAVVPILLGGVALLAAYVPASRATRVDPTTVLRLE